MTYLSKTKINAQIQEQDQNQDQSCLRLGFGFTLFITGWILIYDSILFPDI